MFDLLVTRQPFTGAWAWACTVHGPSAFQWWRRLDADMDALGHVAAHHPPAVLARE